MDYFNTLDETAGHMDDSKFDETIYPMELIYDAIEDKYISLDDFQFDETLWDNITPSHFNMKSIFEKMDEIEYVQKDKDLRNILEDIQPDLLKTSTETKRKRKPTKSSGVRCDKRSKQKKTTKSASKQKNDPCVFEVEKIIDHNGNWENVDSMQFKVRWSGYTESDDTWEPFTHLDTCIKLLEDYCERNR